MYVFFFFLIIIESDSMYVLLIELLEIQVHEW
jgi:hypothetical protein